MIKELIPPFFLNYLIGFFYGWTGNYKTWAEARKKCSGYNTEEIFDKVRLALLAVKNGEAVFERDSVIFDKVHYSFPLLSALSLIALQNERKLNVLDFGGSLGSSYFQNRSILRVLDQIKWCIVEQPHFVKEGQKNFADDNLQFFYNIKSCTHHNKIDLVLLASVIQYMEHPYSLLDEIIQENIPFIMIDRTPVFAKLDDRITVQKVPKKIYNAQYPCWILNEKKIINYLSPYYDLVFDFSSPERMNLNNAVLKAYFFKRKSSVNIPDNS